MGNKNVKFPSEIDLVKAAQHEYDFLRMIDAHPALYKEPVIRNAIYRYEQYWLPLVAEHEGQFLPAPLDIEWVWHCHILNPFQYRHDCEKIVNKVVDHRPYKLCEANRPQSERYWKGKYENIPFEVDLKNDAPSLIDPSYIQQSLYDIASATLRQRSFNYGSSLPHYRDRKFLKKAVWRYYIMLEIKKEHPNTFIVPCYDNDLIWHTHQQHPLAYQQDTSSILGKMLDHNDTTSDRSPGSELENGSAATKNLWKQKGHKFAVPGAMYRGEPPMPEPKQDPYRFISLKHKEDPYAFYVKNIVREGIGEQHIKDILHHIKLMAPYAEFQQSALCEYFQNTFSTLTGVSCFIWRVVHCKKSAISAIEILYTHGLDTYDVLATAHTIGTSTIPTKKQIAEPSKVPTHNAKIERSFLIRGTSGDFAILKAKWRGFVKGQRNIRGRLGQLQLKLFKLGEANPQWVNVAALGADSLYFRWNLNECTGSVDLDKGSIQLSKETKHVPENICIAASIAVAFVLCQPRPPPPKDSNDKITAYIPPSVAKPGALNLDAMQFLVAGGLYASTLPRWYHVKCHGEFFYQIHPHFYHHHYHNHDHYDYDYDYNGGGFDSGGGFEVDTSVGGFETDFDSGGGDWGDVGGDTGGCGGCGGCGGGGGGGGGCGGGGCGGGGCGGGGCGGGGGGGGGCGGGGGGGGGCGGGGCGGD